MPARAEKPPPEPVAEETPEVRPDLPQDMEARIGELQRQMAAASGGGAVVRLKVEEPHAAVTFGGVTVGRDFTEVPVSVAADLVAGAADAGVTVTQDQES